MSGHVQLQSGGSTSRLQTVRHSAVNFRHCNKATSLWNFVQNSGLEKSNDDDSDNGVDDDDGGGGGGGGGGGDDDIK